MITFVEFRAKQGTGMEAIRFLQNIGTGNQYLINYTPIIISLIAARKRCQIFGFQIIYLRQKSATFIYIFFVIEEYKIRRRTFISDTF